MKSDDYDAVETSSSSHRKPGSPAMSVQVPWGNLADFGEARRLTAAKAAQLREATDQVVSRLQSHEGIARAFVRGSSTRGTALSTGSDVDIVVVSGRDESRDAFVQRVAALFGVEPRGRRLVAVTECGIACNLVCVTPALEREVAHSGHHSEFLIREYSSRPWVKKLVVAVKSMFYAARLKGVLKSILLEFLCAAVGRAVEPHTAGLSENGRCDVAVVVLLSHLCPGKWATLSITWQWPTASTPKPCVLDPTDAQVNLLDEAEQCVTSRRLYSLQSSAVLWL